MEADSALQLLLSANQLKRVPRTGWVMRGVVDAESVSDHTFGVTFASLVLAQMVDEPLDTVKMLTMALIHDLPEAILGDIPAPSWRHFPEGTKPVVEEQTLRALLTGLAWGDEWQTWWCEFGDRNSLEAMLVRDADRLDLLIQAFVYSETTANRWLEEFWAEADSHSFELEVSRSVFEALCHLRGRSRRAGEVD